MHLDWFKNRIEKKVDERIDKKIDQMFDEMSTPIIKTMKLINNTLTIVFTDGEVFSKNDVDEDKLEIVSSFTNKEDIFNLFLVKEKVKPGSEEEYNNAVYLGWKSLLETGEFEEKEDSLFLKGIPRSLPNLMIKEFVELNESIDKGEFSNSEKFLSLKRFFMWCCLNPVPQVANDLYGFLKNNSFRITKQGFFVALRNVVTVKEDNELVKFVSNAYNKVKAVWRKKPEQYNVIKKNGEYKISKTAEGELIGNLSSLYIDLPNMENNRFTDAHTQTFDIRVGRVVNMPREDCSFTTAECNHSGLHFCSDAINYVGCGDTSMLILINPYKVVGIGSQKGRCYEYLPIMTVPKEEVTQILHDGDFDTLQLDEDYAIRELENLQSKVEEGFVIEAKKHQFYFPELSKAQIMGIVKSLGEMKAEINERIVNLD